MKPFTSPSISIDGEAIRRIREEGKLTQLYVAKVVGVTTDTVSRWENNRYPTIRRDNALRLAEALDVELEQIVRHDDVRAADEEEGEEETDTSLRHRYLLLLLGASLLAGVLFVVFHNGPVPVNLLSGTRLVPNYTAPGTRVPIQLEIVSKKSMKGLIVREEFPPGWNLVEADPPPASLDNLNGSVRWMVRNPRQKTRIVYILQAPENSVFDSEIVLRGEVVANPDGQRFSTSIPSSGRLKIAPLHWADMNGNSKIDDLEILEVSDLVDDSKQLHFGWDLIDKIWDAGGYTYDAGKHRFLPKKSPSAK